MRAKLFQLVEGVGTECQQTDFYDVIMMTSIAVSMLPLMVKESGCVLNAVEWTVSAVFIVDYALRLLTADLKLGRGWRSYLIYPSLRDGSLCVCRDCHRRVAGKHHHGGLYG